MNVLAVLKLLEAESGRKAKLDILEQNKNVPYLKEFFEHALNPFKKYYIKKFPATCASSPSHNATLGDFFAFLPRLQNRVVTGHAALDELCKIIGRLHKDDAEVARRVIIKDPRCGCQESSVTAVWPDLIPTWPCLLAKAADEKTLKKIIFPAVSELKSDGMRINHIVQAGAVTHFSRSGRELEIGGGQLDADLLALADGLDCVFDGELRVLKSVGSNELVSRKEGNGILNKAQKGTLSEAERDRIVTVLWDKIPLEDFRKHTYAVPYSNRREHLMSLVEATELKNVWHIGGKIVNSMEEAEAHFQEMLAAGEEGTMLKNFKGIWEDKRSHDIVKMKAERTCELRIIGFEPGKVGTKREGKIGSLIGQSEDGKVVACVSGFSDELLDEITRNFDTEWKDKIMTVLYNERISSKNKNRAGVDSLFLPRFQELRTDKFVADSSDEIK